MDFRAMKRIYSPQLMIIHCPPDYEVVPCFKLQSSIFLKKSFFVQLSKKLTGGKVLGGSEPSGFAKALTIPIFRGKVLAAFDILVVVICHLSNGSQEIKRSKSLGDGLPQSRQRREERWRRRVSGFIQSAVGALKPEPAVESSQVSVTALPCNQIRPGQTTTAAMYASHSTMQWSHVSQQI